MRSKFYRPEIFDGLRLKSEDYFPRGEHISIKKQRSGDFPVHWHNFFELEIILDGRATHFINGEKYDIEKGSAYIISPVDYHRVIPDGEVYLWNVMFDETMLSDKRLCEITSGKFSMPFTLGEKELLGIDKLLWLLSEESKVEKGDCTAELFESLLCMLSRNCCDGGDARAYCSEIQRAVIYLETHFRESPTLIEISSYVGFNPAYFSELFKKYTGATYTERLNELRINYAKKLLSQGLSVSEACYACGFGSLSNFQHIFKKNVKISPSEYKKNHRLFSR